jgi:uroporphyrinogen III methyltransferase/synthase
MNSAAALRGLRILVTRPEGKTGDLCRRLEELGAHVIDEPLTRTAALPESDYAPLDESLENLDRYDWLLFTSDEGVRYCLRRAAERRGTNRLDALLPATVRVAVIGPRTADAVRDAGRSPDLVASDHHAEGLVQALKSLGESVEGRRFLLVRAARGREVLPNDLRAAGAEVDVVTAYRTEGLPEGATRAAARLSRGEVDLVLATSGAALDELASALACRKDVVERTRVAALGPVTAAHARSLGFEVSFTAESATIDSLVEALAVRFGKEI